MGGGEGKLEANILHQCRHEESCHKHSLFDCSFLILNSQVTHKILCSMMSKLLTVMLIHDFMHYESSDWL